MNYKNTPQLTKFLEADGLSALAGMESFVIDDDDYQGHVAELSRQKIPRAEIPDHAVFVCLTFDKAKPAAAPMKPEQVLIQQDQLLKAHSAQVEDQKRFHGEHAETLALVRGDIAQASMGLHRLIEAKDVEDAGAFEAVREAVAAGKATVCNELSKITDHLRDVEDRQRQIHVFDVDERRYYNRHAWIRCAVIAGLILVLMFLFATKGHAQNTNGNIVVAVCGTPPSNYPAAGQRAPDTVDTNGTKCAQSSAPVGGATSANQTNGAQKTQIVDSGGNVVTVTGNKLDVNATVSASANQTVDINLIKGTPELTPGKVGVLAIAGADTSGSTSSAYPVLVSALSGGNSQSLVMSTSGSGLKVDGSGYTQPVSGTVTVTDGAGALNVIVDSGTITTVGAVTAITNALPAGANVIGHVIADTGSTTAVTGNVTAVQGTGTNLHTVVDSGTIGLTNGQVVTAQFTTANIAVNVAQLGAAVISAAVTAGIMPVAGTVTAGTNNTVALPIQGVTSGVPVVVNQTQVNGVAVTTGSGTSTNTMRVVLATPDPCQAGFTANGLPLSVSITTSSTVITGVTGQHVYICGWFVPPVGTATNIAMVYGTGTVCGTSVAGGPTGGSTAATGAVLVANQGFTLGFAGRRIGRTETTGDNVCLLLSAANQISGTIDYVIAP